MIANQKCPVCKSGIAGSDLHYSFNSPTMGMDYVAVHSSGSPSCVDRLVTALLSGTVSIDGGSGGSSSSKAGALALALAAIEKNPAHAERILALAERALS